ncbi:MAG: hypothetical protein HYT15_02010 [Candidatus Magasanikbacteria bacterium]|nr:hypothetical protein [Candidatus Magasanikbacteria bacterium]
MSHFATANRFRVHSGSQSASYLMTARALKKAPLTLTVASSITRHMLGYRPLDNNGVRRLSGLALERTKLNLEMSLSVSFGRLKAAKVNFQCLRQLL